MGFLWLWEICFVLINKGLGLTTDFDLKIWGGEFEGI
jgi:hypothetical protein